MFIRWPIYIHVYYIEYYSVVLYKACSIRYLSRNGGDGAALYRNQEASMERYK